jgi:hypothetical protein
LDPKYVDVVILRWQSLSGQTATLEGSGLKTFDMVAAERKDTSAQDRKPSRKLTAES